MKKITQTIFFTLITLTPVVEIVNASYVHNNILLGNIGQAFKLLLIVLAFILIRKKEKAFYVVVLAVGILFTLIHYILLPEKTNNMLIIDLILFLKISYLFPVTFALVTASQRVIIWATSIAWGMILCNILLGVLGLGNSQYALGYGFKGFFYSGNEMALTFIVVTAILLYELLKSKRIAIAIIFCLVSLIVGILQGMKTLLIGLPLVTIIIPVIHYYPELLALNRLPTKRQMVQIILTLFIGLVTISFVLVRFVSPQFFVRFGEIYQRSGLVGAVLSGRNAYLKSGLDIYVHEYSVGQRIFGAGSQLLNQLNTSTHIVTPRTVEMDPIDMLFSLGALAIFYYMFWIILLRNMLRAGTVTGYFSAFINILLLVLSIITGHVVYSAFLATYWAMANSRYFKEAYQIKPKVIFAGSTAIPGGIAVYMTDTASHAKGNINITVVSTHKNGNIAQVILSFITGAITIGILLVASLLNGQKIVLHLHMATHGSFFRKLLIIYIFSWFSDATVLHIHGATSVEFFTKLLSKPLFPSLVKIMFIMTDTILVVSKTMLHELQACFSMYHIEAFSPKWNVLNNAIPLPSPLVTRKPLAADKPLRLLYVGRFVRAKNILLLIQIAASLKKVFVNFSLTLVGDGPERKHIEAAILSYGVADAVTITGAIPHEKIEAQYKKNDLLLLPSHYESFGIVVLEAYTYGLPAITSNVGGLNDIVIDGKTGYRYNPNDLEGFVSKIAELHKSPKVFNTLRKNAQAFVLQFDYPEHIKQLQKIYASLNL